MNISPLHNLPADTSDLRQQVHDALHMGNYYVLDYDIARDRVTNIHGSLMPAQGITLSEFTALLHPGEKMVHMEALNKLTSGEEHTIEVNRRWNVGTASAPKWQCLAGHLIVETDNDGQPAHIIGVLFDFDATASDAQKAFAPGGCEEGIDHNLAYKYRQLTTTPALALSFYDDAGYLMDLNDEMKRLCGFDRDGGRFWEKVNMFDVPAFRGVYAPDARNDLKVCQKMDSLGLGLEKWIELHIHPVVDRLNHLINYLVCSIEITNTFKNAQELRGLIHQTEELRQQIERYETTLADLLSGRLHTQAADRLEETQRLLEVESDLARNRMRLKSEFMASMTHELRTPLNAIVGFTSILLESTDAAERDECIQVIRNSCEMLHRLINDILVASSFTEGHTSVIPVHVDFSHKFDAFCHIYQQRMHAPVEFIKENPFPSLPVVMDIDRVQQVITNFVTNAAKFTDKGYIKLGYKVESGDTLYIYCEDTGTGIPQEKQQKIFERFVKLNEFAQGTGMGLAICRSIARQMNGEIGVHSEGLGQGSTFWLRIPLITPQLPPATH